MADDERNRVDGAGVGVSVWNSDRVEDYGRLRPLLQLPLLDWELLPTEGTLLTPSMKIAKTPRATIVQTRFDVSAVGVNVLNPTQFGFVVVKPRTGDCFVNGLAVEQRSVFLPGSGNEFYLSGGGREVVGISIDRDAFIRTLAALRGCGPEDIALNDRCMQLGRRTGSELHRQMTSCLERISSFSSGELENRILGLLTDAYLTSHPDRSRIPGGSSRSNERIVRLAEERFASVAHGAISLADLCAASGVGKTRLYDAFHAVCGEPPLSYFRRRRLVKARSRLLASLPERGSVKRVALDLGLTEMGRFAVEYRRLFGESPSVTVNRAAA